MFVTVRKIFMMPEDECFILDNHDVGGFNHRFAGGAKSH